MAILKAVNWNEPEDDFTKMFWEQNIMQFWTDEEIPLTDDKMCWITLDEQQQDLYKKVLGGLTLLDTVQGDSGMPCILSKVASLQRKAVLGFMGMMEHVHAKSYSSIFMTLAMKEEIDALFQWVENHPLLQKKANLIKTYYENIKTSSNLFLAMAASVLLESYLFYSGFFYPLLLSGQGKMTSSGEIIDLILRDESIHGVYVGLLAQEQYASLSKGEQKKVYAQFCTLFYKLHELEEAYTLELYSPLKLQDQAQRFIRYNANKAFMNLGFEAIFPPEEINPIVFNGIRASTKQHDFFSQKGNGYVRALHVEAMTDSDFIFEMTQ